MFNKILKNDFCKFVTAFLYISTVFLICKLIFISEFTFYPISVAKASTNPIKIHTSHEKAVSELFSKGLLKDKIEAPRSEFFDQEGNAHILKEFKRNFIILYFWASWSSDCISELEKLNELKKEMEYQDIYDLIIVPISIDFKSSEQLRSYLDKRGIDRLMLYVDSNKEMMAELGFHSLPWSFLIDKNGKMIAAFNQSVNWSDNLIIENILKLKGPADDFIVPAIITPQETTQKLSHKKGKGENQEETIGKIDSKEAVPNQVKVEKSDDNIESQDIISQDIKVEEPKKKKITFIR